MSTSPGVGSGAPLDLGARARELLPQLLAIRRDLHMYPELGFEEFRTSRVIREQLDSYGLRVQAGIAETGLAGVLNGKPGGKTVALRVEIDALPIQEKAEGRSYASRTQGVMHACGHDGHVAIALGVARILAENRDRIQGSVKFIFQPGEERPKPVGGTPVSIFTEGVQATTGAAMMIDAGVLRNPEVDLILGIHLWPDLLVGTVGIQQGASMAGVGNFHITLHGRSTHAAMPSLGVDAIAASVRWLSTLQESINASLPHDGPFIFHVGTIQGGYRRNVVADRVDITGTVRAYDSGLLSEDVPQLLETTLRTVCEATGASYEIDYCPLLPPVMNDPTVTDRVSMSLAQCLGPDHIVELSVPAMTGDDFAVFAARVPAAHLKFGCANPLKGISAQLHSTSFDFDEDALSVGVHAISQVILDLLRLS